MKRLILPLVSWSLAAACASPRADEKPVVIAEERARAAERSFAPGADVRHTQRMELPPAPVRPSDSPRAREIEAVLRAAIRGNPNLAQYADTLLIVVDDAGAIRLRGRVDSLADARFLSELAMSVDGVETVYADVFVDAPPATEVRASRSPLPSDGSLVEASAR